MHPARGGRIVLDLEGEDAAEVRYRAALFTPTEVSRALVTVRLSDGEVAFDAWDPMEPPPWLVAHTRAFLRSEWKARKADPEPWPSRIQRWREEKA